MSVPPSISLIHGDCLDVMIDIPDDSIDMILADLPFGTTRQKWDSVIDFNSLWKEYKRITKPNAAIILFAKPPFDKVLACSNLPMYRYDWIWEKTRATGHLNANRMPLQAHENICVFYKKPPDYYPQKSEGHKPVNAYYTRRSGECYGSANQQQSGGGNTDRHPRSVLKYAPVSGKTRLHPNQKPIELLKYLIKTYTRRGALILDNTMGVGSVPGACRDTNRDCIGIESDVEYYNIAISRLSHEKG